MILRLVVTLISLLSSWTTFKSRGSLTNICARLGERCFERISSRTDFIRVDFPLPAAPLSHKILDLLVFRNS
jgi:hypothetical protein